MESLKISHIRDYPKEKCKFMVNNQCAKRNIYRNCVLPRCCGICPKADYCEELCEPIINKWSEEDFNNEL